MPSLYAINFLVCSISLCFLALAFWIVISTFTDGDD